MTQISSPISLVLAEINANVARLTGLMSWMTLNDPATVDILAECFPRVGLPGGTRALVEEQARNLAKAGYALVAVNRTAPDRKARDNDVQPDLPAPAANTSVPGDISDRAGREARHVQKRILRLIEQGKVYRSESGYDLHRTYIVGGTRPVRDSLINALIEAGAIRHSRKPHPDIYGPTTTWEAIDRD